MLAHVVSLGHFSRTHAQSGALALGTPLACSADTASVPLTCPVFLEQENKSEEIEGGLRAESQPSSARSPSPCRYLRLQAIPIMTRPATSRFWAVSWAKAETLEGDTSLASPQTQHVIAFDALLTEGLW